MSGDIEFGKCDICKDDKPLQRKYYHYEIKCECHSPKHFEFVSHCKDCVPIEPTTTKINVKTKVLKEVEELKDFAIWLTGCGYDFTQHKYFIKQRDKLLKKELTKQES